MRHLEFLLLFPLLPAVLLGVIPQQRLRSLIVWLGALAIGAVSIHLAAVFLGQPAVSFPLESAAIENAFIIGEIVLTLYLLYQCRRIRSKEWWIPVLILVQAIIIGYCELSGTAPKVESPLYVDSFSVIMALIIGIIGSLICVYALSYMEDYHHHHGDIEDGRRGFFLVLFLFLSGMFGVVFSNNLSWMYFFWEVTTLCSFLLIGYSRTEEATRNAFLALGMNAIGGLGFALALLWLVKFSPQPTLELSKLLALGPAVALVPAILISFAGLTKSAQLPFSSWLLGAMVAPTPVSALLHSSTMVKAGVFVVVKFAPVLQNTVAGLMVALVGGVTFLMASLMAVTQSNAKRVLAYSTIANLGLIVACAGIGSYEALWAAVLLIIFHAVSKGLLFLGVGTIEHRIDSRDIEDMEGLIVVRPALALVMLIGIMGMFLAPFGMLISKWTCLQAFVDRSPLLAILLAFGSAPTLFFWAKWMGKLVSIPAIVKHVDRGASGNEWAALGVLSVLTVASCVLFPVVSSSAITPYLQSLGLYGAQSISSLAGVAVMAGMLVLMLVLPVVFLIVPKKATIVSRYLAGANLAGSPGFTGAMAIPRDVTVHNYYLSGFLSESKIANAGAVITIVLILASFFYMVRP